MNKKLIAYLIIGLAILGGIFYFQNNKSGDKKTVNSSLSGDKEMGTPTPTTSSTVTLTVTLTPVVTSKTSNTKVQPALADFTSAAQSVNIEMSAPKRIVSDGIEALTGYTIEGNSVDSAVDLSIFDSVTAKYGLSLDSSSSSMNSKLYESSSLVCTIDLEGTSLKISCW